MGNKNPLTEVARGRIAVSNHPRQEPLMVELLPEYEGETMTAQLMTKHNGEMYLIGEVVAGPEGRDEGDMYEMTFDEVDEIIDREEADMRKITN